MMIGCGDVRVIISAGGTGGHIYPALAIIDKIKEKEPNSEFLYIGTHNRMEKDIVPKYGVPFKTIEIYGFYRNIFKNVKTVRAFLKGIHACKKMIRDFKPDIVIGVGGYVTGPVIYSAKKLGYKTFIHEQNSIPGKANLFLSKYTDAIGVSFESSKNEFKNARVYFTGNPCSEKALKVPVCDKREFGLDPHKKLVYIVMGSLGSSKMTELLVSMMCLFQGKDYEVLFVTGKDFYEDMKKKKIPSNVHLVPYVENQTRLMKKADLIVTRCGASTLSEIIALQIPSILIPSPYVPNNHQYKNGMDFVKKEAAIMIEEKDLKGDILVRTIDGLLRDSKKMEQMRRNLSTLGVRDSATKIYDILYKMVEEK